MSVRAANVSHPVPARERVILEGKAIKHRISQLKSKHSSAQPKSKGWHLFRQRPKNQLPPHQLTRFVSRTPVSIGPDGSRLGKQCALGRVHWSHTLLTTVRLNRYLKLLLAASFSTQASSHPCVYWTLWRFFLCNLCVPNNHKRHRPRSTKEQQIISSDHSAHTILHTLRKATPLALHHQFVAYFFLLVCLGFPSSFDPRYQPLPIARAKCYLAYV